MLFKLSLAFLVIINDYQICGTRECWLGLSPDNFLSVRNSGQEKFGTKRVIGLAFFYRVKSVRGVGATR